MQSRASMRRVVRMGAIGALILAALPAITLERLPEREAVHEAVELFEVGRYRDAAEAFAEAADHSAGEAEPDHAAELRLWSAKASIAGEDLHDAIARLEQLRREHPRSRATGEALYHLGRVAYLDGRYPEALQRFARFVEEAPGSPFIGNAYYWAGEALLALGHLDESEVMFETVVESFPESYRAATAESRLDLMDLRRRDAYFRRLLRWSHEEQLSLLDELERRELALEEAVEGYRVRLFERAPSEYRSQLLELEQERRGLKQRLEQRDRQLAELEQEVFELRDAQAAPETTVRAYRRRFEALELKAEALEMRRGLLSELLEHLPEEDAEAEASE